MLKDFSLRLAVVLMLAGMLLSACSSIGKPAATEVEIVFDPGQAQTQAASTPVSTPTLRPTPTATATLSPTDAPTPTNTLDPYNALIAQGIQQRDAGEFDAVDCDDERGDQNGSENPAAYIQRGITYNIMGNADQAIVDFNFALNYDPNSAEAYNARGVAWSQKGQFTQAILDFNKALELKPDYLGAFTNRGISLINQQQTDEALADFNRAVELEPDNPEVYFNRGQAYLIAFGFASDPSYADLCIADFTQAIALDATNSRSFENRAKCRWFRDDFEGAYEDYTEAIRLAPEEAKNYFDRAILFPNAGTLESAQADAQKVLELTEDAELKADAEKLLKELPTLVSTATPQP